MARVDGVDYAAVVLVAVVKTQGEMNVDEIAPVLRNLDVLDIGVRQLAVLGNFRRTYTS